ncbi:AraC family transcriptional regulator [Paenibacillus sambharensis]|uniref:AraC family transcriptional regulator n=1 Tax=Paenibacillus sambharensis TaxID=1803190 RepID=A0A2W1L587_9BACL|nr:helix-turn-helix domain-containing protein [Paenibacillus sambharensis]PZD94446.1 AraC family transcriptional regulator [Paenibacillus sambharensis]
MKFNQLLVKLPETAWRRLGDRGRFYRQSLILFLLIASIPGFITGVCIYFFGVGGMERDLSDMHRGQVAERVRNIDDQLAYLELDLSHWAFSPRFGSELKELDYVYSFQETYDITKTLVIVNGSHPLIDNVELFIDRKDPVLFKPGYYKLADTQVIQAYRGLLADPRSIYWTGRTVPGGVSRGNERGGGDASGIEAVTPADAARPGMDELTLEAEAAWEDAENEPIRLVHRIPGESPAPFGVLVVTLKQDRLASLLKTMTPYNEGATFLLDEGGQYVISDKSGGKELQAHLREEVLKRKERAGTFLWEDGGVTYSVSYGPMRRVEAEWTYISAAPVTAITSPVVTLSNIILLISTTGLLLALLLSWLASRRMYSPVERLIRRFDSDTGQAPRGLDEFQYIESQWSQAASVRRDLENRLNDQLPSLRTGFLFQLVQGHLYTHSEEHLRERMKRYGWETPGSRFYIVHFQLTGWEQEGRFSYGDESLLTFAAANIMEELAAARLEQYNVLNFHDLSVGLFVIMPEEDEGTELLSQLAGEVTSAVNRLLRVQVAAAISRPVDTISRVTEAYMELERAAGFRRLIGRNQLLNMQDPDNYDLPDGGAEYPFGTELELVQAMRQGKREEAEAAAGRFLGEAVRACRTETELQQTMLQLLGSIRHMMLESGVNPLRLSGGANLFGRLSQLRDPQRMLKLLKEKAILPFLSEREALAGVELRRLVEQTIEYIQSHFAEDISLESCADLAGTSSYTLSRLFKQVTGVNFIDYVTELRINRAKELLRCTDMKVTEVAEAVGYQQRYFNRIFKKQSGVTPTQYREMA